MHGITVLHLLTPALQTIRRNGAVAAFNAEKYPLHRAAFLMVELGQATASSRI